MKSYEKSPRTNLNRATQIAMNRGKTVGGCSVLTVIRDEELASRRNDMQPVRQRRREKCVHRGANGACAGVFQGPGKGLTTWVHKVTCLCKIF
jgi:hypothetical protein